MTDAVAIFAHLTIPVVALPAEHRRQLFLKHCLYEPADPIPNTRLDLVNHAVPSNKLASGAAALFFSMAEAAKISSAQPMESCRRCDLHRRYNAESGG
jgi:hypothetical protein